MSHQTEKPAQSAVAADSAPQPSGPSAQTGQAAQAAQTAAQTAGQSAQGVQHSGADAAYSGTQQHAYHGQQGHQQYRSRNRDFHVRRNSHSRTGGGPGGPGQPNNNGYRSRGGSQSGHRFGQHSRGGSFQHAPISPQMAFQGQQGAIPMYAGATAAPMPSPYYTYTPGVFSGTPGSPNNQAQIIYPPFQMPAGTPPVARPRVAISDASGNPVDLRTVARHHHHERSTSETPSAHSRSPSVTAPEPAEQEPNVKKASSGGSVVQNMKAMIAARKKEKAEAEAAAAAAAAADAAPSSEKPTDKQPISEKPAETTDSSANEKPTAAEPQTAQATTSVSAESEQVTAEPKVEKTEATVEVVAKPSTEPPAEQQQPKPATPETEPQAQPEAKSEVKSEAKSEDEPAKKPAWKSATVAKIEAQRAQEEAESKQEPASAEPEEDAKEAPKDEATPAPKKAAWKAPSLVRLEAEKAKAAAAAAAASETPSEGDAQGGASDSVATEAKELASEASSAEPAESQSKQEAATESSEELKDESKEASKEATPTGSEEEKVGGEQKQDSKESKDAEEAAKQAAFIEALAKARPASIDELEAHKYPASAFPNEDFGSGDRYLYTPEFLQQFEPLVPRIHFNNVRAIVGFEFTGASGGSGRWGSGMGPRSTSSRGPSRVGSYSSFGRGLSRNASGAQSVRGRQGSRRRGDRQGSRRDRDDVTANGTPIADLPPLKKAENAWTPRFLQKSEPEVTDDGRLSPEEVQRKVKSLLNKLAWENFVRISTEIRDVALQSEKETTAITLRQIIQLTFEKAIDEPHWSGMYAHLFWFLHVEQPLPDTIEDHSDPEKVIKGVKVLRRYLLNMSQKDFEKGWSSTKENSSGAPVLSDEYYQAIAQKRRGLGLIQFVGELYKLGLISDRLLTSCFVLLMDQEPTEDIVESTSRLLKTVAPMILQKNGKQLLDSVMGTMKNWRESGKLAARLRFMIMDVEDLARKNWEGVGQDGPKTIAQVHEEAVKREQAEARERTRRGGPGGRRGDFGRPFVGGGRRR